MTRELVSRINDDQPRTASALNFICGALVGHDSASGANPYAGLDVERVFAAVQLLAERRTLEVTPFVANWHPAVDGWDRPSQPPPFFDRDLQRAILSEHAGFNRAYKAIASVVDSRVGSGTGRAYQELAEAMVGELRALVQTTSKKLDYLEPLVRQGARSGGLTIATLNYDRSIELAAQLSDIPLSGDPPARLDPNLLKAPGIRLLKLHGSIDWEWASSRAQAGAMPQRLVRKVSPGEESRGEPALIFGARGKLRADGPFLTLLALFEEALSWATRLIVIGYSFRDPHVNEMIRRWTANSGTMVIVDPALRDPGRLRRDFRAELIASLNPPARGGEGSPPRVELVESAAGEAIAHLFDSGSPV
jgi:hypothetical protein